MKKGDKVRVLPSERLKRWTHGQLGIVMKCFDRDDVYAVHLQTRRARLLLTSREMELADRD